ncbi:unnamed protein product [Adineta ricciae]|uniref:Uncharacterized protein n=1 Tax=Adineta ricciae TaxID=249248 RepID=A0A814HK60_ADIRI|nr:unnamed protein product [Adineta ricciae]
MKRLTSSLKKIYFACGRTEFLRLVQKEHGEKMSRFLRELDIDSAQCLINIDLISIIQDDEKFLSKESRDYLFKDGTEKIRPIPGYYGTVAARNLLESAKTVPESRRPVTNPVAGIIDLGWFNRISNEMKTILPRTNEDDSFSSGAYEACPSVSINELNDYEQLEHQITTTRRIDYFLTQYCLASTTDLSNTKIRLLHHLRIHEEQLYEILMYLRNTFGGTLKENLDKNELSTSVLKMLGNFKPVGYYRM